MSAAFDTAVFWGRKEVATDIDSGVKVAEIAYVRFSLPELGKMSAYLTDFGMVPELAPKVDGSNCLFGASETGMPFLYMASEGPPRFIGMGFTVNTMADLQALTVLEGASSIEAIDGPGGGQRVRFTDPNGYEIDAVFGRSTAQISEVKDRGPFNWISQKGRPGRPVRLQSGPSKVRRVGHCVINVLDFEESQAWYKARFGFLTSNEIHPDDDARTMGAFLRCDQGDVPTDHHTVFLIGSGEVGLNHIAFEVEDWDDLMLGHTHLKNAGHQPHWGVGKHVLGSQVFDYWKDPFGFVLEHYTDGDIFDSQHVPTRETVTTLLKVQWGPDAPKRE